MDLIRTSATEWQQKLEDGSITSVELTRRCLAHITNHNNQGLRLHAVLNVAPMEAMVRAAEMDQERSAGRKRSGLHGIPIVIKDVFSTEPSIGLPVTCGAQAMSSARARSSSPVVQRLFDAGLIILATANLTEFCGLRADYMRLGWSTVGGQTQSPYVKSGLLPDETPIGNSCIGGSSSGSAASVAAGFAPMSIGTETSGSLIVPANRGGLFSLKLTPESKLKEACFSISSTYDSLGPMAKSAKDVVELYRVIAGWSNNIHRQERSISTFTVGFVDPETWRYGNSLCELTGEQRRELSNTYASCINKLHECGANVVEGIDLPSGERLTFDGEPIMQIVPFSEFRIGFNKFVGDLDCCDVSNLEDLVEYNERHKDVALISPCDNQKNLILARDNTTSSQKAQNAAEHGRRVAGDEGIARAMSKHNLDLILGPGDSTLYMLAACAGCPMATMPLTSVNYSEGEERPEGLSAIGKIGDEQCLLDFMLVYEKLFPRTCVPKPLFDSLGVI